MSFPEERSAENDKTICVKTYFQNIGVCQQQNLLRQRTSLLNTAHAGVLLKLEMYGL